MSTTVHLSPDSKVGITRGISDPDVVWLWATSEESGRCELTVFLRPEHLKQLMISAVKLSLPVMESSCYTSRESRATAPVEVAQKENENG